MRMAYLLLNFSFVSSCDLLIRTKAANTKFDNSVIKTNENSIFIF